MTHHHVSKVLRWGLDGAQNYAATLYGCTGCNETSPIPWPVSVASSAHDDHTDYVDGCFACKAATLQLNPGDAGRPISDKKWTGELDAYKRARSQGIQPTTTRMKDIVAAEQASEKLGRGYDGTTMPPASSITTQHAAVMNEVGI